jgi:hypothetical protein
VKIKNNLRITLAKLLNKHIKAPKTATKHLKRVQLIQVKKVILIFYDCILTLTA